MSPSRARGRPRSEERRDAVLKAAMELMQYCQGACHRALERYTQLDV